MTPVAFSSEAIADLEEILDYGVATFGEQVGEDYVTGFDDVLALIVDHPLAGSIHETVRPPIRSIPHGRHRIYYDVLDGKILVQRILHHAMDVERHLRMS